MKTIIFLLIFAACAANSQTNPNLWLTVFYFGASDCPHSTDEKTIADVNKIKAELPSKQKSL